jgi:hypothetical protein
VPVTNAPKCTEACRLIVLPCSLDISTFTCHASPHPQRREGF